jgi:aryl-alcohol dehydrogenase-like predicted oxidoreductase
MHYRTLGSSNLSISSIGVGTWAMGGPWEYGWGSIDDTKSIQAIHQAFDLGVNFIDTADVYGLGHAEEVVGKAIKDRREDIIVATKFGLLWDEQTGKITGENGKQQHVFAACEASLKRLQTDYIDLYQIHWPDTNTPLEETLQALEQLVSHGKIRYFGVSNFSIEQLKICKQFPHFCSDQPPYNILSRRIEKDVLPFCKDNHIGLITYAGLAYGYLTGTFNLDYTFEKGDWRGNHPAFKDNAWKQNLEIISRLKQWVEQREKTLSELAIAWVLSELAVTTALVGSANPKHVKQNIQAINWKLSQKEREEITNIANDAIGIYFD